MININELIKNAMKSKNQKELKAYKNLKAEIQILKTSKNAKPYDEVTEVQLISKMCKKLEDEAIEFTKAGREDLASEYRDEKEVLEKLLPPPVGELEIDDKLKNWVLEKKYYEIYHIDKIGEMRVLGEGITYKIPKKEMGNAIKYLKSELPQADGKMISEIVKKYVV